MENTEKSNEVKSTIVQESIDLLNSVSSTLCTFDSRLRSLSVKAGVMTELTSPKDAEELHPAPENHTENLHSSFNQIKDRLSLINHRIEDLENFI